MSVFCGGGGEGRQNHDVYANAEEGRPFTNLWRLDCGDVTPFPILLLPRQCVVNLFPFPQCLYLVAPFWPIALTWDGQGPSPRAGAGEEKTEELDLTD